MASNCTLVIEGLVGHKEISAELCNTPSERTKGLMFRKKAVPLWFVFESEEIYPIHSWFVFFKFDAVYVSNNAIVTEVYPEIQSWSYVSPKEKAKFLLELPAGKAKELGIATGSRIEAKYSTPIK